MIDYWKNNKRIHHNGDDPITRAKMVESWKRTIAKKSPEEISKWRKAILRTKSKIAQECLNNISKTLNIIIQREYPIYTYHVDGYIEDKCIFEFFGNYWHANPEFYNIDDKIQYHGKIKLAKDVWEHDRIRLEKILNEKKLPIIIIWEQHYNNNKDILLEQIKDYFVKEKLENGKIYYF